MTFKSKAVLDTRPNFGTVTVGWVDNVSVEQTGFGVDTLWKLEPYARRKGTLPFIFFDRDEILAFETFVASLQGRLRAFWVPTWTCDLIPKDTVSAGDAHIDIETAGLVANFSAHPGFKFIAVISRGTLECAQVTSVEATTGGERLNLSAPLATTPDAGTVIVSWLLYARLADDEITLDYETDDCAECKLKVIELPAELATAGTEGRPVYLYKFESVTGNQYLTSYAEEITVGGITYTPADINHGTIDRNAEFIDEGLALEVNTNDPEHPLRSWMQTNPASFTRVTVYEHFLDTLTTTSIYVADVMEVVVDKGSRIQVTLSTLFRLGNSKVPRITVGISCNWQLFSTPCGLLASAYRITGSATYRTTDTALVSTSFAAQANGYYAGGRVIVGTQERTIATHTGNTVWLTAPLPNAAGAVEFQAWPGCDNQFSTCKNKFANNGRYGGAPYWPAKNPQLAALETLPHNQGTKKG